MDDETPTFPPGYAPTDAAPPEPPEPREPPPGFYERAAEILAATPPTPPEKVDNTAAEYRAAVDELLLAMLEEVDL